MAVFRYKPGPDQLYEHVSMLMQLSLLKRYVFPIKPTGNQGLTRQSSPQTAGMIFPTDKKRSIRTPNDLFITQDII